VVIGAAILDLAEAVDLRFSASARHAETVGRYAEMLARELGLPKQRIERCAGRQFDRRVVAALLSILDREARRVEEELTAR